MFNEQDYKEQGTDAIAIVKNHQECQTSVQDLCGESIGIKKRFINKALTSLFSARSLRPMFFPDHVDYSNIELKVESANLINNPLVPEQKKKHIRVRKLLSSTIKVCNK